MTFVRSFFLLLATALSVGAQSRLTVTVDSRIELMAVTEILADYGWTGLLNLQDTAYRRDVDAWFAPYKQHLAVKRFAELAKAGYAFDGPAGTMVCLSSPPELALQAAPEQCAADRAGGAASLQAWLVQLRAFAAESDFMTFFRAHAGLYSLMEQATRKNIVKDYAADLEAYYGVRQASYTIVLAPLLVGNFGPRVPHSDGTYDIYGVLGAGRAVDGIPAFGSIESLRALVWHEFGHSFSNPQVDRFKDAIAKSQRLFPPIEAKMRPQAYPNWHTSVIEHVDRAVTTRLAYRELGSDAGDAALAYERRQGFAYVPALAERLKEYEEHRERYADFAAFAPRLFAVFDELAATELPPEFYQIPTNMSISDALTSTDRRVVIIPTAEADQAAQAEIQRYARGIRQSFGKDSELLSDEEALTRDLSGFSIMAYGTIAGNKWLARYQDRIPALPVLETSKEAHPLRLIAAFPNPQNPKLGAVAFTATDAAAVPDINSVFAGPTGWVLARGTTVLSTGDYVQRDGRWLLK
jgi:hypothetical protein